jgi:DNA-binding CsgD family transcriptional regulator
MLTILEVKVIMLVCDGLANAQIAEELQMSENTVKSHLRIIYQKCGIKNRHEMIKIFRQKD